MKEQKRELPLKAHYKSKLIILLSGGDKEKRKFKDPNRLLKRQKVKYSYVSTVSNNTIFKRRRHISLIVKIIGEKISLKSQSYLLRINFKHL